MVGEALVSGPHTEKGLLLKWEALPLSMALEKGGS